MLLLSGRDRFPRIGDMLVGNESEWQGARSMIGTPASLTMMIMNIRASWVRWVTRIVRGATRIGRESKLRRMGIITILGWSMWIIRMMGRPARMEE